MVSSWTLMIACSNEDSNDQNLPEKQPIIIDMPYDSIQIWNGTTICYKLKSEGDFIAESKDNNIATAEYANEILIIRTNAPGKTEITVKDKTGKLKDTSFVCKSVGFNNTWGENDILYEYYDNYVIINADNRENVDIITTELLKRTAYRYLSTFKFNDKTNWLMVSFRRSDKRRYFGTYEWDYKNRILILKYNNKEEKYKIDVLSQSIEELSAPFFIVQLSEDYTKEYATRFSEDGITEVTLVRYLMAFNDRWMK